MSTLAFQPDARSYYDEGHWRPGDLWSDFAARAGEHPERVAIRAGDASISYGELERAARALSGRLGAHGVATGDVVVLLGRHCVEAVVALLGVLHRGAVLAPLPPMFGAAQLSALIAQSGATAIVAFGGDPEIAKCEGLDAGVPTLALRPGVVDGLLGEEPGAAREPIDADAMTLVLHSSGTTSAPKGIVHSSNTIRYAGEQIVRRWELRPDDTHLVVCEFGFVGSLVFGYFVILLSGATGVLLPRWDADEALRLIEEHRCAYVLFMPTHAADVIGAGESSTRDWSSLRALAAPGVSRERRISMSEIFGLAPLADYGLSEVPGHAAHGLAEPWEKMVATEGRPFEGTDLRVVDADGASLPAGEIGEVLVNGPSRFLGFLGNDELTRASLTGWGGYRTGDRGLIDADGHLTYVGRSKDIIRRAGVTLVPSEIEPVILRHPSIHEVAVVPLPDERLGERACAAVIVRPGHRAPSIEELQEFLGTEGLSKYSWPESVEIFDDFPRTSSLKAVKREIVNQIFERATA
jgi:acyl-CoA synthetase (AMP-forming)/AMP-acid ligase II